MPSLQATSLAVTRIGCNNFTIFQRNLVISYACASSDKAYFSFFERKQNSLEQVFLKQVVF